MAKRRRSDFLSQERVKTIARGVTTYLAPMVGGKPVIMTIDRSGRVELKKFPKGKVNVTSGGVLVTPGTRINLSSKHVGVSQRPGRRSVAAPSFKTIQRLAGR